MTSTKYTILYTQCNTQLAKYNKRLEYDMHDLELIVDLYDTGEYINKCIDCQENIGTPSQLCGKIKCLGELFVLENDHYTYCDTMGEILDKFVYLVKLIHENVLDDEVDDQLKKTR